MSKHELAQGNCDACSRAAFATLLVREVAQAGEPLTVRFHFSREARGTEQPFGEQETRSTCRERHPWLESLFFFEKMTHRGARRNVFLFTGREPVCDSDGGFICRKDSLQLRGGEKC